jgi:hypothetical protein
MPFSNKNLIDLSQFTIKAKGHIGMVKVADMIQDEQYATEVLVKAALSENAELASLSKLLSSEFNSSVALVDSSEAYIQYLIVSKVSEESIHQSKYFLIKLNYFLHAIDVSGTAYRQAVNRFIEDVGLAESAFCIKLARDYYYFWRKSNRVTVLVGKSDVSFAAQKEAFVKIWHQTDDEFYSGEESWALSLYARSIKQFGATEEEAQIRLKIAKVITIESRKNMHQSQDSYRDTVNRIQNLLSSQEMIEFLWIVSREYYLFWLKIA